MQSMMFSTKQLAGLHREAFNALPEPYRDDDCLLFWRDMNGTLCATPRSDQTHALGDWVSMWNDNESVWQDIPSL